MSTYLLTISSDDRETNQNTDDITLSFSPPLRIAGNWSMALESMTLWYSYYNISSDYGNQTFRYFNGSTWKDIIIAPGLYPIEDLNDYLQSQMLANGDYTVVAGVNTFHITISANFNTFKCLVSVDSSYEVDFSVGNLYQLLGFTQIIVNTTQEGVNNVNITNGVDRLLVHCDIVTGSYKGGSSSDVLYSFAVDGRPSSLIQINPNNPIYLPINQTGFLYKMRLKITDQQGRRVNFNNETITYSLYFQQI